MNRLKILLVGLGNYTYPNTRHNVGMMVLDQIVNHLDLTWSENRSWKSETTYTKISVKSKDIVKEYEVTFLKPKKLMNISGSCIAQAARDLHTPMDNLYVFHDDMQRDLGKVSLKSGGSANGHNGIKSIIDNLKKKDFKRVRIGIGRPPAVIDDRSHDIVSKFVLGKFSSSEMEVLKTSVYPLWTTDDGLELLCESGELKKPVKKKKEKKQKKDKNID